MLDFISCKDIILIIISSWFILYSTLGELEELINEGIPNTINIFPFEEKLKDNNEGGKLSPIGINVKGDSKIISPFLYSCSENTPQPCIGDLEMYTFLLIRSKINTHYPKHFQFLLDHKT